jgi:hypothetical protein
MHKFAPITIACLIIISSGTIVYSQDIKVCTDTENNMTAVSSYGSNQSGVMCLFTKSGRTEKMKIYTCVFESAVSHNHWQCSEYTSWSVTLLRSEWEDVDIRYTKICGNCSTGWKTER